MKKKYKVMLSCLLVAVIAMCTVSPTFSWLTDSSETVVNYFAGGKIAISLDEAPVDEDGKEKEGDRVTENTYKYTPGAVLDKDPTPTVLAGSEECYVYVCVKNQLPKEYFTIDYNTSDWEEIESYESDSGTIWTVYRYKVTVETSDEDQSLSPIFTTITVSTELTQEQIEALGTKTVEVQAYAVQADAIEQADADTLALEFFGMPVESTIDDAETPAVENAGPEDDEVSVEETQASESDNADNDNTADSDDEQAGESSTDNTAEADSADANTKNASNGEADEIVIDSAVSGEESAE